MNFKLLLACWQSGQIEPSEMVKLCRDNPQLQAIFDANSIADAVVDYKTAQAKKSVA